MRRDLLIKSGSLAGTSDFRVLAPIKKGLVPSLDAVTYKTRVKRVLRTLHVGRTGGFEYEFARILSDAVERVGCIHSVGIAVLEPEDKVPLTVTFDGAWESYVRVIWQKVSRLLDLIFCNTDGYVLGYENSYEKWGAWLKQAQSEAYFLYATPGLTVDDTRYLQMEERVYRREAGSSAESRVTRIRIPTTEEIAERGIFSIDGMPGVDPTNAGFSKPLRIEQAGRPPFRQGVRSVVGLYRLADVYPPDRLADVNPPTTDGVILHRAAHELLPEFDRMLNDGNTYQLGIQRALKRFPEAMRWMLRPLVEPEVRQSLPVRLPDEPLLQDPRNVQGGILQNYPDVDHGCLLLLQFASPKGLADFLNALEVTSQAEPPLEAGKVATNVAFTVEGLRVAGLSDDEVRELPEEFVQGMERRAGLLGDLRINHPRRWRLPALNWHEGINARDVGEADETPRVDLSAVHAALQVRLQARPGATVPPRAELMAVMERLVGVHPDIKPLSLQWMQRQRNSTGEFEEHFGFVDSNSDPVLSRSKAGNRFSNQIHLGELLCGYPNLADKKNPLADAPERVRILLQDGSFLVMRKLRQDVGALDQALNEAVAQTASSGHPLTRDELKAKMMGRWPGGSDKAGDPLADADPPRSNNFHFNNDPQGALCPFHAHIRRANPRIINPAKGSRPPRIVRRGMSYGAPFSRNAGDAQRMRESLNQERGLVFMAYNASLGEQFEVLQHWLNGGNSSGSYSGESDPLTGFAESGRRRYFRFEHQGQTIRMALDGSDRLHDEPRPFVRLEWGAYFFAPSGKALAMLQQRAQAAHGHARPVTWSPEAGEFEIARLLDIEKRLGRDAAIAAWKTALEDPDAGTDFTTASIWAAIRERHGGVLQTPFAVLVAEKSMVDEVLLDRGHNLSVKGYLPRMHDSFGEIYLGLDAGQDGAYERESAACNDAIMALSTEDTFERARKSTKMALQALINDAISDARIDGESSWDLTVDVRELVDPLLADFCEEWFGLSTADNYFARSGYRWDWKPGQPPNYPGHFLAPSRYFFQPHPGDKVENVGKAHGLALRSTMTEFLRHRGAQITARVARAILDSAPGRDLDFAARTLIGAVIGFVPTVNGNILRILNEWLREGTLWSLRARLRGEAADFHDACNRLGAEFIPAMQLRTVPEVIWRTATAAHTLGEGPHQVEVKPGEIVVIGAISATQQSLQAGSGDRYHAFGGNRREASHPTHACPGADPALAVMLGFFSALVDSPLALRAGPGPLTLALNGRLTHPADDGLTALLPADALHLDRRSSILLRDVHAFEITNANVMLRATTTQLVAIGDSWLCDTYGWDDLASSLRNQGYDFDAATSEFASGGRLLAEMASDESLTKVKDYLTSPGAHPAKALLIGGGGNDVVHPDYGKDPPTPAPLFRMLVQSPQPGQEPLVEEEVRKFIDVELRDYYKKILDTVRPPTSVVSPTDIPILIHAYDHPIPDGRPLFGFSFLKPIFVQRGYNIPEFPVSSPDLVLARDVMRRLIDRLNRVVAGFADDSRKIYYVKLTETLASHYGSPQNYAQLWANELHPTAQGFDFLAAVIATKLRELNIG
jgi:Dyp-type peroxidase family